MGRLKSVICGTLWRWQWLLEADDDYEYIGVGNIGSTSLFGPPCIHF